MIPFHMIYDYFNSPYLIQYSTVLYIIHTNNIVQALMRMRRATVRITNQLRWESGEQNSALHQKIRYLYDDVMSVHTRVRVRAAIQMYMYINHEEHKKCFAFAEII